MNAIAIDIKAGTLTMNGTVVAPLEADAFVAHVQRAKLSPSTKEPAPGFVTYCLTGELMGEKFGVNITYSQGNLESVWMSWAGGISGAKGYDTSEAELIRDKASLSKLLTHYVGKRPDLVAYNHDIFKYEWGYLSVACSIRSTIVTVGFHWAH